MWVKSRNVGNEYKSKAGIGAGFSIVSSGNVLIAAKAVPLRIVCVAEQSAWRPARIVEIRLISDQEHAMPSTSKEPANPAASPPGKDEAMTPEKLKHLDEVLDEALIESFPASDPIAVRVTRVIKPA